jgi:hypothetical protein
MTKATYLDAANKHAVREFLFSFFKCSAIIGLAGPNINEYIKWCKSKGYKDIEIWENTPNVLMHQMMQTKHPVRMRFGNILQAEPNRVKTLYDLDYCATVYTLDEHIAKFKDNFIMTFSLRAGVEFTIKEFFKARKEKIVSYIEKQHPIKHTLFTTKNKNKYIYTPYCDTSAMCCIAKIN